MPETPTAAELAIPATSIAALMDITDGYYDTDDEAEEDAVRVAAPVVAAELRRIADHHQPVPVDCNTYEEVAEAYATERICGILRARADVLDPPARQED